MSNLRGSLHPLLIEPNDPHIEPLQGELVEVLNSILRHFAKEMERLKRKDRPPEIRLYTAIWNECWLRYWGIEFFCDLFSVFTVGPAFAWSHYHLAAKRGSDLFAVPTRTLSTHPADAARMKASLLALEKVGFVREAGAIRQRWDELVSISGSEPQPEYYHCYPEPIIESLVQHSLAGTQGVGCNIVGPGATGTMFRLLNEAWWQFWKDPQAYSVWEQQKINSLRQSASPN